MSCNFLFNNNLKKRYLYQCELINLALQYFLYKSTFEHFVLIIKKLNILVAFQTINCTVQEVSIVGALYFIK